MMLVGLKWILTTVWQMLQTTASEMGPKKGSVTCPLKGLGSLLVDGLGGVVLKVVVVAHADFVYQEINKTFFKC